MSNFVQFIAIAVEGVEEKGEDDSEGDLAIVRGKRFACSRHEALAGALRYLSMVKNK
jgi:hypothetical protein